MRLAIVTTNEDKYHEISSALRAAGIETEHVSLELEEVGDDIRKIAADKAKQAFADLKRPLLVDDTGVFFDALGAWPGVRAKRVFKEIGYDGLFDRLEGKDRSAHFETVIAYADAKGKVRLFSGTLRGTIAEDIAPVHDRGSFIYERIFIPEGYTIRGSQMSFEKKAEISHRTKATKAFVEWYTRERV